MDGVLIHEEVVLPGAEEFISRLQEQERQFLVLTNNSIYTRRDLSARLSNVGLNVPEEQIWTSAAATAQFLSNQVPDASAYVIGEAGLKTALHKEGYLNVPFILRDLPLGRRYPSSAGHALCISHVAIDRDQGGIVGAAAYSARVLHRDGTGSGVLPRSNSRLGGDVNRSIAD